MANEIIAFDPSRYALSSSSIGLDFDQLFGDGSLGVLCVSNYPQDQEVGQEKYLQSQTPAVASIDQLDGEVLEIEGFTVSSVESIDGSGEVHRFYRITLFDPDGVSHYSSSSDGVLNSIRFLAIRRGMGLWNPPARVKVLTKKTAGGRPFHQLQILPEKD